MHSRLLEEQHISHPGGFDLWNEKMALPNWWQNSWQRYFWQVFWKVLVPGKRIFGRFGWYKMIWGFRLLSKPGGTSSPYLVGVSYCSPCQTPQHPHGRAAGVQDTTVVLGFWEGMALTANLREDVALKGGRRCRNAHSASSRPGFIVQVNGKRHTLTAGAGAHPGYRPPNSHVPKSLGEL